MKKYYIITFEYNDSVYCTNIAHSASRESVEKEYSKYNWFEINEINGEEVWMAKRKGMPIVEL